MSFCLPTLVLILAKQLRDKLESVDVLRVTNFLTLQDQRATVYDIYIQPHDPL